MKIIPYLYSVGFETVETQFVVAKGGEWRVERNPKMAFQNAKLLIFFQI